MTTGSKGRSSANVALRWKKLQWSVWGMLSMQNVLLRFESFELEAPLADTTCYDAVTVYDGTDDQSPVIGSYCGTELPADILASTNHLFIVFQSDSSDNAPGFRAHYSGKHGTGAVDGKNCCQIYDGSEYKNCTSCSAKAQQTPSPCCASRHRAVSPNLPKIESRRPMVTPYLP